MPGATASPLDRDDGSAPLVRARALTRRFGTRQAVDQVSFDVARGEAVGLVGPNGAGKTTLLKMLAGVVVPDSGHVAIAGRDLARAGARARRRIGFLPDPPPVVETATVREHLTAGARLYFRARDLDAAVEAVVAQVALTDAIDRRIGQLSHGYRQRVGLARTLIGGPDVVLLDEPTGGLDPVQTRAFLDLIDTLKAEAAIVLSSHHLAEVARGCDRVLVLGAGRLLASASAAAPDVVAAGFRGMPPAIARLETLPGVERVTAAGPGRVLLTTSTPDTTVTALVAQAAEHAWPLDYLERRPALSAEHLDGLITDALAAA